MVSLDSKIRVADDVLARELDGESVLLDLKRGTYFGLNAVGTRMWTLLAEHGQVRAAYATLSAEYDVAPEQLQHDLLALVENLSAEQLVEIDDP